MRECITKNFIINLARYVYLWSAESNPRSIGFGPLNVLLNKSFNPYFSNEITYVKILREFSIYSSSVILFSNVYWQSNIACTFCSSEFNKIFTNHRQQQLALFAWPPIQELKLKLKLNSTDDREYIIKLWYSDQVSLFSFDSRILRRLKQDEINFVTWILM